MTRSELGKAIAEAAIAGSYDADDAVTLLVYVAAGIAAGVEQLRPTGLEEMDEIRQRLLMLALPVEETT